MIVAVTLTAVPVVTLCDLFLSSVIVTKGRSRASSMGNDQQFSLRWNNYLHHITGAFYSLRSNLDLVDVTLSCEGKKIKAHKMLLSACSSYFRELFKDNPCKHPVIIFRDVKYNDLEALVDFMYQGEVNVVQEQLNSFLNTAELLEVQGLTEGSNLGGAEDLVNEVVQPKEHKAKQQPLAHTEPVTKLPKKPVVVPSSPKIPEVSFIPVTKRPETPPIKKRKYSVTRGLNANIIEKDVKPPPRQSDSPDPIEIVPMIRSVKIENPEYFEQDSSYSDQVEPSETNMDTLEQVLASSTNNKQEAIDIYSSNSGDSTQHGLAEGLLDLNQMLGTPGPSGEPSQDGLQGVLPFIVRHTSSLDIEKKLYHCPECRMSFKHATNLCDHKKLHTGETVCHLCNKVLSSVQKLRRHLAIVHRPVYLE